MICIVCKQAITGISNETKDGPVHLGECTSHYNSIAESLSESSDAKELLESTELLAE